jgi:hypothetical protein
MNRIIKLLHVFETVKSYPCKEYDIQVALNMKLHYLMHVHCKNEKNLSYLNNKNASCFPEIDSKHSESEWNQESVNAVMSLNIFSYFYNLHALNNVISYSVQPEYHIIYMDSFLQSQKHAII